ncbi:polysaccharide deacetylase family protein [Bilophila wadsworthia]|uniref:polysaccharide deacetylase family protein n=1 Tax=Bilophila wadsworthia TaxID=35833 RepID=UPI00242AC944|nr:polysaccharide deacetylase family protein [Bilophila wadsworthia]
MPWKKDFTLSDEMSPSGIVWPAGKAAVSVVVDYSVPAGAEGIDEAAIAYARTVWGNAVSGGWLIDYLNAYGVKATFAVPLAMARAFPESVRRAHADGHEIAAGSFAKEDVAGLSPDEERERIERTLSGLAELTGTRPEGWFTLPRTGDDYPGGSVSDATGELLLEAGCGYFGNSMADDIPHYWITDYDRRHTLLMLPYYYAMDTQFFMFFPGVGKGSGLVQTRALWENWAAELEGVRAWGRQSTFVIQPYLMQFGAARAVLDRLMRAVTGDPDRWSATSGACAAYWKQAYPADRTLRFEKARVAWMRNESFHGWSQMETTRVNLSEDEMDIHALFSLKGKNRRCDRCFRGPWAGRRAGDGLCGAGVATCYNSGRERLDTLISEIGDVEIKPYA